MRDKKVIAGLCAHSHKYARGTGFGGNDITWEVDSGNAGRLSHADAWQTFIDITVGPDGVVQFDTWQGRENEEFTLNDSWTVTEAASSRSLTK